MKNILLVAIFFITSTGNSFEITRHEISNGPQSAGFLAIELGENHAIAVPVRSSYYPILKSKTKNTWALSYHQMSNYEGVDLVLDRNGLIFIDQDIWKKIMHKCIDRKIDTIFKTHATFVRAKRISDDAVILSVLLIGESGENQKFDISVRFSMDENGIEYQLEN